MPERKKKYFLSKRLLTIHFKRSFKRGLLEGGEWLPSVSLLTIVASEKGKGRG